MKPNAEEAPPDNHYQLQYLVHRLVSILVDTEHEVDVSCEANHGEFVCLVRVAPGEVGQLIGKRGRNMIALRDLVQCRAGREGIRVRVEIEEGQKRFGR